MDAHLDATAVSIRNARGAITNRLVVPTTRAALRRALNEVRGRVRVLCESGPLAAWLRDGLQTRLRDVIVCDRRRTRLNTSGAKADRIDADRLSDLIRRDTMHVVHVPTGDAALLRRYALHYVRMQRERSRVIQRLHALFYECGIRVQTPKSAPGRVPLRRLITPGAKFIARAYQRQLEVVTALVEEARASLLGLARQSPSFEMLQTVPYIGEVRAAELMAIAETPERFRSIRSFWAYGGLGVVQKSSSEHRVENGKAVREERTRGMRLRVGHPLLKKVLRDIALHASIGRGPLRAIFDAHVARGKTPAVARVALARKIAAIIIAVWRSDAPYSERVVKRTIKIRNSGRASSVRSSVSRVRALRRPKN